MFRPKNEVKQDRASIEAQLQELGPMTKDEKNNPEIINKSRKERISKGSGVGLNELNKLLKQFRELKKMMKKMSSLSKKKNKRMGFPFFK